ncbi:MAG: helix-turn-helix domain-containing protein [Chitinophagales bacterium]
MGQREIGYRIQIAREEAGLNQKELAERLGYSQSTLSNYEKGKRRLYLAQLQKIAEVLGKPVEYFMQPFETETNVPSEMYQNRDEWSELLQLMNELGELSRESRQSAIDYIRWLKSREGK